MGQYEITFSCGHEGTVTLTGPYKDKQSRQEWFESQGLCPDCYKAYKQEQQDKAAAEDAAANAEHGLPPLEGSPKQIKWAEQLRHEYFATHKSIKKGYIPRELEDLVEGFSTLRHWYCDKNNTDAQRDIAAGFLDWITSKKSAKWWIDHCVTNPERCDNLCSKLETGTPYKTILCEYLRETNADAPAIMPAERRKLYLYWLLDKNDAWCPKCPIEGRWNGKVYKNRTVYVDGDEIQLSEEEYAAAQEYATAYAKYREIADKSDNLEWKDRDNPDFIEWVQTKGLKAYKYKLRTLWCGYDINWKE